MNVPVNKKWSKENNEKLIKMWSDGASSGLLAREFHKSKGAIIHKIRRLKLEFRNPPSQRKAPGKKKSLQN